MIRLFMPIIGFLAGSQQWQNSYLVLILLTLLLLLIQLFCDIYRFVFASQIRRKSFYERQKYRSNWPIKQTPDLSMIKYEEIVWH